MPEFSKSTKALIQQYQAWHQSRQPKSGTTTVHVDEVASKVAAFYEKIRGVVDWREEHLMRRAAIERILKRRLFIEGNGEDLATKFVYELIRGGYFPNDLIEESKIDTIRRLLDKYVFIINKIALPEEKLKMQFSDWLLSIAACEAEEVLDPDRRERALISYMEELMKERIAVPKGLSEEEKNIQISIAVQKALFKLDNSIICYHLLKKYYPDWLNLQESRFDEVANSIYMVWKNIERSLRHRLSEKFYQVCERYDTPYLIFGDVLSEDPVGLPEKMKNGEFLEVKIQEAYNKRLKTLKTRLGRAALFSTLSIFIGKMLIALAIEVPFDKLIEGQLNFFAMGLSVLIPPSLMLLIVLSIRPPRQSNLNEVIMETMKIVYERERKDVYEIRGKIKLGWLMTFIISIAYIITFILSFGLLFLGLEKLSFSIISIIIFILFVCLISYAGVKIRERSKELEVTKPKEGILTVFIDLFSLPIIRVGKWLSGQWSRVNIFVTLFNTLIDLPFQSFVEFLEQWRAFLKEKKEEIH